MTFKSLKGNLKAWPTFAPTSRPRKMLQKKLINFKTHLARYPKLKRILLHILDTMPAFKQKLQLMGRTPQLSIHFNTLTSEDQLSPQAKDIYCKLSNKINDNKGNQ